MQQLHLSPTAHTPEVQFDPASGRFSLRGCSIPENADAFFLPLLDLMTGYGQAPRPNTLLHIELSYFNSSTSKYLLDLFRFLEDLHASGRTRVAIEWYHEDGDLDMVEAGEDYRALLEIPVRLVAV